ncbi:MAG: nicotinate (nicotinamide) nucleotide adenylyltransferase [Candidatus Cloacimonas sp.]|jgi:nicotinate-nucleotide adenylyltransferase|nr:nicotinate (nicotinamide) nucleotide adenylyltransferase [Candidatus Cloacimonas sp.]
MKQPALNVLDGYTAVLGGSFDPIHLGHLQIAKQILHFTGVANILFVPNGKHHFKGNNVRLSFQERYALVQAAIMDEPRFAISTADVGGTGYTAHLLQKLIRENPCTQYTFVLGADNLATLPKWFDFNWLAEYVYFLVLPRPGCNLEPEILNQLKASVLPIELIPISSTQIRDNIAHGISIQGLVPKHLEQHIIQLYHEL